MVTKQALAIIGIGALAAWWLTRSAASGGGGGGGGPPAGPKFKVNDVLTHDPQGGTYQVIEVGIDRYLIWWANAPAWEPSKYYPISVVDSDVGWRLISRP